MALQIIARYLRNRFLQFVGECLQLSFHDNHCMEYAAMLRIVENGVLRCDTEKEG